MTDKVREYKLRKAARIKARLDAKGDNDEGRWVTTENDNRVHLNKNGVPDKGNPFVIAAMTGKKPKLSMNYHQKNVEKAIKTGKSFDVEEALEKLPNGSKILLNGQKYKAEFFNNEFAGGRGVEFVNEEDQDDILQSYEVTDELINNGDVSLEAPDRKENESNEPSYEPDIEPEENNTPDDEEFDPYKVLLEEAKKNGYKEIPDEPDDLPYDMKGVGETPQETPDTVPDETAPQEAGSGASDITSDEFKQKLLVSVLGLSSDESYDVWAQKFDTVKELEKQIPEGTEVHIGDHKLTKHGDPVYPYVDSETGALVDHTDLIDMIQEGGDFKIVEETEEVAPQEAQTNTAGYTVQDFLNEMHKAQNKKDMLTDEEWDKYGDQVTKPLHDMVDGAPVGTTITLSTPYGDADYTKLDNGKWFAEGGAEVSSYNLADVLATNKKYGLSGISFGSGSEEVAPQDGANIGVTFEDCKQDVLDVVADLKKNKFVPDNAINNAFKDLPDGTTMTTKFGAKWEKKTGEGGLAYFEDEHGHTQSAISFADSMSNYHAPNWDINPPGGEGSSKSYAEMTPVEQHKKDLLDSIDKFKKHNTESDIIKALDQLDDGDVLQVGKHTFTKQKDKNGSFFDKYVDENGTVSGNYSVKLALKEAAYLDQPIDLKGAEPKAEAPAQSQFNFSSLQSEVNKLKGQTGLTKADKEQLNNVLNDAPVGTTIAFSVNGDAYEVEKQSDGKWKENKHGGVYSGYNVANSLIHNSTELESYLPENESKNSDPYNLGEWNPSATSNHNANANTSTKTGTAAIKANGTGAVQDVKSYIDDFVSDTKNGFGFTSKSGLSHKLNDLEDGSSVKVGAKTYVKSTDENGDTTFQNATNEYDSMTGTELASKIASKAQTFDNPIIEVNDPANSPKIKKSTNEPVYIPESVPAPKKSDNISFSDDDFSQERKDAAVWDTGNGQTFDNVMRGISGKVWQGLSVNGKSALYEYTGSGYRSINNFLRKPDHDGQSEEMQHKMRYRIGQITKAISQSQAPKDMWVQRGIPLKNLKRLFGISDEQFNKAESNGMSSLLDAIKSSSPYGQDEGFMSCGSTKGHGFSSSDVILNIYCPKGTQMLYAEPFSAFGNGGKKSWDGTSKQSWFSSENETILQRGTKLVPTKITKSNGKYYVDVEVIGQEYSDKI